MTRIIAGIAGGRRLKTPPGEGTRPTSDRVREALFSALESTRGSLAGARVLDLYAGSGALGLEAWSRGAARVCLVEQNRRASGVISGNVRSIGVPTGVASVADVAVSRFLSTAAARAGGADETAAPWDVVLLDPPYSAPPAAVRADLVALAQGLLAPGATVVVERPTRGEGLRWPPGYEVGRVRRYGETSLHFGTWTGLWYGRADPPTGGDAPSEER